MSTAVQIASVTQAADDDKDTIINSNSNEQAKPETTKVLPKNAKKAKPSEQVLTFRREFQQCCKFNDVYRAMELYQKAKNDLIHIEAQTYYNLLNLCDGLGGRGVHIGTPKQQQDPAATPTATPPITPVDELTRQQYAQIFQDDMKARNIPLNETAYTATVRMLAKAGRLDEAYQILLEAEQTQQCKPRLRLYSSLLMAYCESGKLKDALLLWNRLVQNYQLALGEREYACLLSCATIYKDMRVLDRVLSDLAEDVLVPSKETIEIIANCFQTSESHLHKPLHSTSILDELSLFPSDAPSMLPVMLATYPHHIKWAIDTSCYILNGIIQTGCLSHFALQPVPLSDTAWKDMMMANASIVLDGTLDKHTSTYQGGGKGTKRKRDDDRGRQKWQSFQSFLESTYPTALDVVIDGANVGYYKQNFDSAPKHVDYKQIDSMVKHFQLLNKKVLLVLHERHFARKLMPKWAEPIVNGWKDILFQAPVGMNDDWFWLHAALWGGRSTQVVTNDEMRDHHFQMLSPRSFLRWKERHQIHFSYDKWNGKQRPLNLEYPAKYSRRIQQVADGLVVPLPKQGDENRFLDGIHVANDDEPEEETYVCIRPITE